jgi:tetratricopeptide (TPR) repeat protein
MTAKNRLTEALRRAWLPAALVVGAFGAALAPVADGDLYWHLAAGREMVSSHALLRSDPFSLSAAGRPWPDVHWLFQLGVYAIHVLGGLRALVLVKCSVVALAAWVLYSAVARHARAFFVPAFLFAMFLCRHLLLVRPVIVTLLVLSIFFLQLERYRRERRARLLLPLPLLQVVWVNVQGLFALGPAVIGAYAVGALATAAFGDREGFPFAREGRSRDRALARARPLLAAMLLTASASLVTPFGMNAVTLPARLLERIVPTAGNVFSANVAENVPPFVLEQTVPAEIWHFKWFLGVLALTLVLASRRMVLSRVLLLGGFVALAAMGNRNVALLYFLSPAIVADGAASAMRRAARAIRAPRRRWALGAAAPIATAAAVLLAGVAAAREPSLGEPAPFRFPSESASLIAHLPRGGGIFSADHQGGYLIWRLYPRFRPYMDTRLILRTAGEYEEYLGVIDHPERFDAFQRRHGFAAIVLPVAYPDRYLGLLGHLYASRDFKLAFTDGSEALFLRREGWADDGVNLGERATTERLLALAQKRFEGDTRLLTAARLQIATLDVVAGELGEAARVLSDMSGPEAQALSGRVRLAAGDLEAAERIGARALDGDARDVRALDLMAAVSARRGELRRAAVFLRQALSVDPFDGEAKNLLATMEEYQHER